MIEWLIEKRWAPPVLGIAIGGPLGLGLAWLTVRLFERIVVGMP